MSKTRSFVLGLIAVSFPLMGCQNLLMTRSDVKEQESKRQFQDQVSTLQRTSADVNGRFAEVEDDLRRLTGRIEVLESRLAQANADKEQLQTAAQAQNSDMAKRVQILQEEIARLDGQIAALTTESAKNNAAAASRAAKGDFEQAEEHFEAKEWRRAILSYQKYRDANTKGKKFAEATYKIGVCFQELGLKDEAKTFYDEVIAKFPKSNEAKKAKTRLGSLKK